MSKKDGLERLLEFLKLLDEKAVEFRLDRYSPDSITVTFSLVGHRVEADFEMESMSYSVFRGDESMDTDFEKLVSLIAEKTK